MSAPRRVLITGASQGIGLAIAHAFAADGCDVAICARTASTLDAAAAALRRDHPAARVVARIADVAAEADVDELVDETVRALGGLDVVIANAGVYGPKGALADSDWDAWVDTVRINLLGVVYCVRRAIPALRNSERGKIVILSGGGATKPLPYLSAYAASKAGVVRFGETMAEELRADGIDVNMVAPGALNTRLLDEVIAAGPDTVGTEFYASSLRQRESGGTPLTLGAELCVFLGSRRSDGITGKLISAPWDPWQRFDAEKARLDGDVYTLRRIVPEDRGWSW